MSTDEPALSYWLHTHRELYIHVNVAHGSLKPCQWCDSWIWMSCSLFPYCCILPLSSSCHRLPSLVFYLFFSSSFVTQAIFSSLPVDAAHGHIIIISKPFAISLPANPMFGLMSHAPHLPRWGAALGPFPIHWPWTAGLCWGATRPLALGVGCSSRKVKAGITRLNRVEIRQQNFKCEWTQDLCFPEETIHDD